MGDILSLFISNFNKQTDSVERVLGFIFKRTDFVVIALDDSVVIHSIYFNKANWLIINSKQRFRLNL